MISRRLLRAMSDVWKGELKDQYEQANARAGHELYPADAVDTRLAEVDKTFESIDQGLNGISPTSPNNALLQETMTSGDFTNAIQSFVNRLAIPGYQKKNFAFEPLVWNDTLVNFLQHDRYQHRGSLDDLELVGEKGRARPGYKDDAYRRSYQVYRWEKQYDFSWEAIRNDDLSYFMDQAALMGESARRTLEKFVSRMYTNATSIARLVGLGALFAQNGRLTSARVSEARMAYNQRVDARNQPINARAAFVVGHSGLFDTARQILASELVPELATNAVNVARNFVWIEDPYITGTAPNLPWWAFPDWRENNVRPFVLARLEGWPGPRIFRKKSDIEAVTSMLGAGAAVSPMLGDFDSGNIVLKVVDIFGTYVDTTEGSYFDFRGGYYSSGTAP
jgi:hypothetical protein